MLRAKSVRAWYLGVMILALMSTVACGDHERQGKQARKSLALSPAVAVADYHDGLVREDFSVASDPNVDIGVRKISAPGESGSPVLLLHGARVSGIPSFDLPVADGSFAGSLARHGHTVYIMDARGYGSSSRPAEMLKPAIANQPLVRSDAVVRDISAVVDYVVPGGKIALFGWATGGHWAGQYAALHPDRVSHLIMDNSLYGGSSQHSRIGQGSPYDDPARPGNFNPAVGAYELSTADSLTPSWDASIPDKDKNAWHDPAIIESYKAAALASDPTSHDRTPPSFRAPSGAMYESYLIATGHQQWDASAITAKVLLSHSEFDFWSRPEDIAKLHSQLNHAARVEILEVPKATHYVHLDRPEHGRDIFLSAVVAFLNE
ncbi:MAG: alpha/beta fold hydrolase [Segniliparus sp.]|uniref:alpha/beta fold hydrolase n=1 Tax=Segniliparus sp. TaxID=2804064 RepID=UPI003F3472DC